MVRWSAFRVAAAATAQQRRWRWGVFCRRRFQFKPPPEGIGRVPPETRPRQFSWKPHTCAAGGPAQVGGFRTLRPLKARFRGAVGGAEGCFGSGGGPRTVGGWKRKPLRRPRSFPPPSRNRKQRCFINHPKCVGADAAAPPPPAAISGSGRRACPPERGFSLYRFWDGNSSKRRLYK